MAELRFCAYQYQHLPRPQLRDRWARAEAMGFDVVWNVDTVVEPDRARHPMFDGPATLLEMASRTSSIRIGTLNPTAAATTKASHHRGRTRSVDARNHRGVRRQLELVERLRDRPRSSSTR